MSRKAKLTKKIATKSQLKAVTNANKEAAPSAASPPQPPVKSVPTFESLLALASSKPAAFKMLITKTPTIAIAFDSADKFCRLATLDISLTLPLLSNKTISTMIESTLHLLPFIYLLTSYNMDTPLFRTNQLKAKSVVALDLAIPFENKNKIRQAELKGLYADLFHHDLAALSPEFSHSTLSRHHPVDRFHPRLNSKIIFSEILIKQFLTEHEYIDQMMYGASGYYRHDEKQIFGRDFATCASDSHEVKGLAAAFAGQLFQLRQEMITTGQLKPHTPFKVLECGGGNGNLCVEILKYISARGNDSSSTNDAMDWKDLDLVIQYHMIERSAELAEVQKNRTSQFKQPGGNSKVKVVVADAKHLSRTEYSKKSFSVVISNELVDMFAPHSIMLDDNGIPYTRIVFPSITPTTLIKHKVDQKFSAILKKASVQYETLFGNYQPTRTPDSSEQIILSKKNFLRLHALIGRSNIDENTFQFKTSLIDATPFPPIMTFLARNPWFFDHTPPNTVRYANLGIHTYLDQVHQFLQPGGAVLTIDYGDSDVEIGANLPRTFFNRIAGHNIFKYPGNQDITCCVNFTTMAEAGVQLGLQTEFYGNQMHLLDPQDKENSLAVIPFLVKSQGSRFKVLAQRKTLESKAQTAAALPYSTQRFFAPPLPVSYAELFNNDKMSMLKFFIMTLLVLFKLPIDAVPTIVAYWDQRHVAEDLTLKTVTMMLNPGR